MNSPLDLSMAIFKDAGYPKFELFLNNEIQDSLADIFLKFYKIDL